MRERATEIEARRAVQTLLSYIGEDVEREGLNDTPKRVVKALDEMTVGYRQEPGVILSTDFHGSNYNQMVMLRRYPFVSTCEHHMLPFIGEATIAYIPRKRVVGLSKLGRLVDCFARRLQIQEAMTEQIATSLNILRPRGLGVQLVAVHQCMSCRGVNKGGEMVTTAFRGVFYEPEVRAEFMSMTRR